MSYSKSSPPIPNILFWLYIYAYFTGPIRQEQDNMWWGAITKQTKLNKNKTTGIRVVVWSVEQVFWGMLKYVSINGNKKNNVKQCLKRSALDKQQKWRPDVVIGDVVFSGMRNFVLIWVLHQSFSSLQSSKVIFCLFVFLQQMRRNVCSSNILFFPKVQDLMARNKKDKRFLFMVFSK